MNPEIQLNSPLHSLMDVLFSARIFPWLFSVFFCPGYNFPFLFQEGFLDLNPPIEKPSETPSPFPPHLSPPVQSVPNQTDTRAPHRFLHSLPCLSAPSRKSQRTHKTMPVMVFFWYCFPQAGFPPFLESVLDSIPARGSQSTRDLNPHSPPSPSFCFCCTVFRP